VTRRLAKKIAGNPWAYPTPTCARAFRRLHRGTADNDCNGGDEALAWFLRTSEAIPLNRAAMRRGRIMARRYSDAAARWRPFPF